MQIISVVYIRPMTMSEWFAVNAHNFAPGRKPKPAGNRTTYFSYTFG